MTKKILKHEIYIVALNRKKYNMEGKIYFF